MDLGSSDRLAMVSEKCIHSVAWPNLSPDPLIKVMEEPAVELPLLNGSGVKLLVSKATCERDVKSLAKDFISLYCP